MPCARGRPARHVDEPHLRGNGLLERSISVRTASRGSGTGTTATLACPPCEPARVSAVNSVDLPENGTPTSPMSFTVASASRRPRMAPLGR